MEKTIINKPSFKVFDDIMEDWKLLVIFKKLTEKMLPDGWVYCIKGQHFVKKEDAKMGDFYNPIERQRETCYFCYEHYNQVDSIFNYQG